MDVTPKKLVESSSRCFICSPATIAEDKIYTFEKKSLDIAERIFNDLMTGLGAFPSWFPVSMHFSFLSNCHSNKHMFERFTVDPRVDLSLGTYVDSTNSNTCQMIYLMFHEAYQWRPNN